jgi:hypothetical protein
MREFLWAQQRDDLETVRGPTCKLYILYELWVYSRAVSLRRVWRLPSQQKQPAQRCRHINAFPPNLAVSGYATTSAAKMDIGVVGVFNTPWPYFRPTGLAVIPAFLAMMIRRLAHKLGSCVRGMGAGQAVS